MWVTGTEFQCIPYWNKEEEINDEIWADPSINILLTDLNNRTDLLWARDGQQSGSVSPPRSETQYNTVGSTVVRCDYIRDGEIKATTQLHVHILPANLTGTLDGSENTGDVQLMLGENKTLECDLLPTGSAKQLDGYWKASVNGEE
ncbi:hypothetical protein FGIG_11033, partial [Fasciola gigantica]